MKCLLNLQENEFTYALITINIYNLMDFKAKRVFCLSSTSQRKFTSSCEGGVQSTWLGAELRRWKDSLKIPNWF